MRADKPKVPYTLLLADDSVTIQRVIELTFADEDVRVVAVSDGGEAIAMLDKTPPDIVLADVGMPGQNGYEVARHIKDTPRLAHIPIVLLTGAFEPIDHAKVAEVGCDGVLAKPFEPQLVIARVKELLAKSRETKVTEDTKNTRDKEDATDSKVTRAEVAESWVTPPADGPPADSASHAAAVADIDDYFDRLNVALSSQERRSPPHEADSPEAQSTPLTNWFDEPNAVAVPAPADSVRYDAPTGADEPFKDLPLSSSRADTADADIRQAKPQSAPKEATQSPKETPQSATSPAAPSPVFPQLVDAFAALLAAEQSGPAPTETPTWPVTVVPAVPAATSTVPDDIVEQVTRRVLDQLSDRVVRETVGEIVLATAERLVKEELERIKRQME